MATLAFDGETHGEIVQKVRRWLASIEGQEEGDITVAEAVTQGAELTKDALRIIASAAPKPIADSELVKALTGMGYKATDATKTAIIDGLDSVEEMAGGSVVDRVQRTSRAVAFQMSSQIARQVLKSLRS
ncbi:MAG: hypothetical protein ACR2LQ_10010 [Acidimicrobiales bacterium]